MSFLNQKYEEISNRFKEWLPESNEGENISNKALTYINQAQSDLNIYREWKDLIVRVELTLTNKAATLPSDCAHICLNGVYQDTDVDGLEDNFYNEDSGRNNNGYYIRSAFTKAAGRSREIVFYYDPPESMYLKYIKSLEDFTASEADEYSFFPGQLLLSKAQLLCLQDDGRFGDEFQMVQKTFDDSMADFQNSVQYENFDMRMEAKDDHGKKVSVESYSLSDSTNENVRRNYPNDQDQR